MRELLVNCGQGECNADVACRYRYYILIGEMSFGEGFSCESYGVKVVGQDGEEASLPNITVSTRRIDELMDLLIRNQVSPVTLQDVVEDWL